MNTLELIRIIATSVVKFSLYGLALVAIIQHDQTNLLLTLVVLQLLSIEEKL